MRTSPDERPAIARRAAGGRHEPQVDPTMTKPTTPTTPLRPIGVTRDFLAPFALRIFAASFALVGLATTGCQVDVGGQTLPSAYYLQDDIQYFPAGPEFKLSKEAAAQKAYKEEMGTDNCEKCGNGGCASCH